MTGPVPVFRAPNRQLRTQPGKADMIVVKTDYFNVISGKEKDGSTDEN